MRKKEVFRINGKAREFNLFQKGDRVKPNERSTMAVNPEGTVESTSADGFFINVKWDKELYPSKDNGHITIGRQWMIDHLVLLPSKEEIAS